MQGDFALNMKFWLQAFVFNGIIVASHYVHRQTIGHLLPHYLHEKHNKEFSFYKQIKIVTLH